MRRLADGANASQPLRVARVLEPAAGLIQPTGGPAWRPGRGSCVIGTLKSAKKYKT